jgi:hypothetical protein
MSDSKGMRPYSPKIVRSRKSPGCRFEGPATRKKGMEKNPPPRLKAPANHQGPTPNGASERGGLRHYPGWVRKAPDCGAPVPRPPSGPQQRTPVVFVPQSPPPIPTSPTPTPRPAYGNPDSGAVPALGTRRRTNGPPSIGEGRPAQTGRASQMSPPLGAFIFWECCCCTEKCLGGGMPTLVWRPNDGLSEPTHFVGPRFPSPRRNPAQWSPPGGCHPPERPAGPRFPPGGGLALPAAAPPRGKMNTRAPAGLGGGDLSPHDLLRTLRIRDQGYGWTPMATPLGTTRVRRGRFGRFRRGRTGRSVGAFSPWVWVGSGWGGFVPPPPTPPPAVTPLAPVRPFLVWLGRQGHRHPRQSPVPPRRPQVPPPEKCRR